MGGKIPRKLLRLSIWNETIAEYVSEDGHTLFLYNGLLGWNRLKQVPFVIWILVHEEGK